MYKQHYSERKARSVRTYISLGTLRDHRAFKGWWASIKLNDDRVGCAPVAPWEFREGDFKPNRAGS